MGITEFQAVGQDLFQQGIVSSHGGNISVRLNDQLIVTRRGAHLGRLAEQDLVETGVSWNDRATPSASSELAIHRAIYRLTQAHAVIHAHPVNAIALSLIDREIVPMDAEGRRLLGKVEVIGDDVVDDVRPIVDQVAKALQHGRIVLLRGHGSFAVGQLLEEANRWTSILEQSCRIVTAVRTLNAAGGSPRNKKNHGLRTLQQAVAASSE